MPPAFSGLVKEDKEPLRRHLVSYRSSYFWRTAGIAFSGGVLIHVVGGKFEEVWC